MAKLTGKLGTWDLPHVHMWSERGVLPRVISKPLISKSTRIATIGSCFAEEIVKALGARGFAIGKHPGGLYYNTHSIRQEIERIFGGWSERHLEQPWRIKSGTYIDPFNSYHADYGSVDALQAARLELEQRADSLFQKADVFVMTLGLTEAWRSRATGNFFRQIPHPDVFSGELTEFHHVTFSENLENLERCYRAIRSLSNAPLIITVSPVPLHATVTPQDIRVANTVSKATLRAALHEFCLAHTDVYYFHSYEIVMSGERLSDFMLEDGRHVSRRGVALIVDEFLRAFGSPEVQPPPSDTSWVTSPTKPSVWSLLAKRFGTLGRGVFR